MTSSIEAHGPARLLLLLAVAALLGGCSPDSDPARTADAPPPAEAAIVADEDPAAAAGPATPEPTHPGVEFSLRLPADADLQRYPALARVIGEEADRYRRQAAEMAAEREGVAAEFGSGPPWSLQAEYGDPDGAGDLRVVVAEGYLYTGGAHGMPLIARHVYQVSRDRLLSIEDWLVDEAAWAGLSEYARPRIAEGLTADLEMDTDPQDPMIVDGTPARASAYGLYEPVLDADGRVTALRLLFPPYQVAPYVAGIRRVEVPVALLRPWLNPELAPLVAD